MDLKEYSDIFKRIKLIVSDVDGTLVNYNLQLSEDVISSTRKIMNAGIRFTLASQRIHSSLIPIAEKLGIQIPLISLNGSLVQDINGNNVLYSSCLNPKLVKKAVELSEKYFLKICLDHKDEIIYTDNNSIFKDYFPIPDASYKKVDNYLEYVNNIMQINILGDNKVLVKKLKNKIHHPLNFSVKTNFYRSQSQKNLHKLDIIPSGSSKKHAIKKLMKHYKINKDEILVLGDWYNDVELFKIGGFNVTLKNGVSELKEKADYVSEFTNDEDGAGIFLKEFCRIVNC